jgi:hypothetical protein
MSACATATKKKSLPIAQSNPKQKVPFGGFSFSQELKFFRKSVRTNYNKIVIKLLLMFWVAHSSKDVRGEKQ